MGGWQGVCQTEKDIYNTLENKSALQIKVCSDAAP